LRNRQLDGFKFTRQYAIGPYFADFVCRDAWLVVELDGSQHAESKHDERRDRYLNETGYSVLRFGNVDALKSTDGVLEVIHMALIGNPHPDAIFKPATRPVPLKEH
jgi:very-short-patch-repair endonuclease